MAQFLQFLPVKTPFDYHENVSNFIPLSLQFFLCVFMDHPICLETLPEARCLLDLQTPPPSGHFEVQHVIE